jgi:plastocyanin
MMPVHRSRPAILAALTVLGALLLAAAAPAKPPTVFINGDSPANYTFAPRTAEIDRRQTVRWEWDSNAAHNVTFSKLGKSSATGASETFRLRFRKRGTFRYVCTVHGFRGKVVVKK